MSRETLFYSRGRLLAYSWTMSLNCQVSDYRINSKR